MSDPKTKIMRTAQVIDLMDGELMLAALKQIREMGYNSSAARATDTVLGCIRVAEAAIGEVENGKPRFTRLSV